MRLRFGVSLAIVAASALVLSGCSSELRNEPVSGLSDRTDLAEIAARFTPGNIVSDQQFYDDQGLTVAGIQAFLERVPCQPKDDSPCLADYRVWLPGIPAANDAPGHCAAVPGKIGATAADVIARVAVACGVNPKMLLVLLQKEQSLLTKPSADGYKRATGYGCPDTADCNAKYFGFVNQVYNAAWQFRQYTQQPKRKYRIGTVPVAYSPNTACGAADVAIANQATANLYNYTPYQPNTAAIADPGGEGDACSAWGNLNVWLLWNVWFGDPLAAPIPAYLSDCLTRHNGVRCELADPAAPFRE